MTQSQTVRVLRPGSAWWGNPSQGFPQTPSCAFCQNTRTLGRCPKPRWGLNPQTPLALRGLQLTSVTRQNRAPQSVVCSRGKTSLTQLQILRVLPAGAPPPRPASRLSLVGEPLARVPPAPFLCFWEDTKGKTLGLCPKPRWGLNPQTPLALRGLQLTSVTRQNRAPQSVVCSRGKTSLTQSQLLRVRRAGSACRGLPRRSSQGKIVRRKAFVNSRGKTQWTQSQSLRDCLQAQLALVEMRAILCDNSGNNAVDGVKMRSDLH